MLCLDKLFCTLGQGLGALLALLSAETGDARFEFRFEEREVSEGGFFVLDLTGHGEDGVLGAVDGGLRGAGGLGGGARGEESWDE